MAGSNSGNEDAVGRCALCGKAVVPSELVQSGGAVFCSRACASEMAKKAQQVKASLGRARSGGLIKIISRLVIGAVVVIVALEYLGFIKILGIF